MKFCGRWLTRHVMVFSYPTRGIQNNPIMESWSEIETPWTQWPRCASRSKAKASILKVGHLLAENLIQGVINGDSRGQRLVSISNNMLIQLDWTSCAGTQQINLLRDREGYAGFEHSDDKPSTRRIQWCGAQFYIFIFWRVIFKK